MIIVEGGDNTGKTTLVRELMMMDPALKLLKREKFHPNRGESIGSSYLDMLTPKDGEFFDHKHTIADRCLASECIYGHLFRDGCRMSDGQHLQIQGMLMRFDAIIVFCNPPDEAIAKDWEERPQLYQENPLMIAARYRLEIPRIFNGLEIIEYDWTHPAAELQREKIIQRHQLINNFKVPKLFRHFPVGDRSV